MQIPFSGVGGDRTRAKTGEYWTQGQYCVVRNIVARWLCVATSRAGTKYHRFYQNIKNRFP